MTRLSRPANSQPSDEEAGIRQAFIRHQQRLFEFFQAQGFPAAAASALAHETFLGAVGGLTAPTQEPARRWLLRADDCFVTRAENRDTPNLPEDLDKENFPKVQIQAIMGWANKLPDQARRCFYLAMQGHRQSEIASLLGISESTVSSYLQSIRRGFEDLVDMLPKPKASFIGGGGVPKLEAEIDFVYKSIAELSSLPATREREAQSAEHFIRLRDLQHREAEQFRQQFEDNLMMPLDAGASILGRSRNLRKQLEDLAAPDSPAEEPTST